MKTKDINKVVEEYFENPSKENYENIFSSADPIIKHYIKKFGYFCSFDDLYQCAMMALMKAIKSYDVTCNTQFSTWASVCIVGEIRHFSRNEKNYYLKSKMLPNKENLDEELERAIYLDEGLRLDNYYAETKSFCLVIEDKIMIKQALNKLTEIQRNTVQLLMQGYTQEQIANKLGLTQKKVSRIKTKSFSEMRKHLDGSIT